MASHLLFADDMLIFSESNVASLKAIDNVLELLAANTGLVIDKLESKVFFSKGCQNKQALKEAIGVEEGKMLRRYLGIPLAVNYLKAKNNSVLIDKCRNKIERWMSSTLSFSGRV